LSCIAGRLRTGPGADGALPIEQMLAALETRAPDGTLQANSGPVAMGAALLRTGRSRSEGASRLTLDEKVWLVADARLDGRSDLLRKLRAAGRQAQDDAPHGELILHAYFAWGNRFLDHLIGDFAFALWDEPRRHLICARDHFGVRPFYFSHAPEEFAFASHIEGLVALPHISRVLDEVAIADFLLVGTCADADRTIFRDIRCLPPATRLDIQDGKIAQSRYWTLSWNTETRFNTLGEYVDRFAELFRQAVEDRTPEGAFAVPLSGGMDSTSIAVAAAPKARRSGSAMTAYHVSAGDLDPADDEAPLAQLIASSLQMNFVRQELGDYTLFARNDEAAMRTAYPSPAPLLALQCDMVEDMERRGARVLLSGFAGDAAICPAPRYFSDLFRGGRWLKLASEMYTHIKRTGSLRGMGLRSVWRGRPAPPPWRPPLPDWVDESLARRVNLSQRWEAWWRAYQAADDPDRQLALTGLQRHMEALEILDKPVVARYPFLDLRLVEFVARAPNFLRADKRILREAMLGKLPESVRTRPKTTAHGDSVRKLVTRSKLANWDGVSGLPSFVRADAYQRAWNRYRAGEGRETTWTSWLMLHPVALANWLKQQERTQ
jgi:asparagine synthase (glutamine-hydrolysing)